MDRRESMPMSGSHYFMQRNIPELHGQQQQQQQQQHHQGGMHQLPNSNMTSYQPNIGGGGSSSTGLLVEPTHTHQSIIPTDVNAGGGTSSFGQPTGVTPMKRKRGRPRKYGSDGSGTSLALSSSPATPRTVSTSPSKRGRGRPLGSGRKLQRIAASVGSSTPPQTATGAGFTPHVINIAAGEDIAGKILAFARQGHRAVCVMSVSGAVSSVTLCQASSGGTLTYEGRYDILHMSGSFLVANNDMDRSGVLSVSLVSPDGRVIGGGIGGMLIAASPVQVILGSFVGASQKVKHKTGRGGGIDPAAMGRGEEMLDHHHHQHQSTENTVPTNMTMQQQQQQQLSRAPPTSAIGGAGGGWPGPQQGVGMQHSHFDIDLMRG